MFKKIISTITSVFIVMSLLSTAFINAIAQENIENTFVLNYDYSNHSIDLTLSIDGDVCIAGFDASLKYDKNKYAVETSESKNANAIVNVVSSKGEILISFAELQKNVTTASEFANIKFTTLEEPVSSDFSFEILDVYMMHDNYNTETVEYFIYENWNGLDNKENEPTTTTTEPVVTTTESLTTTTIPVVTTTVPLTTTLKTTTVLNNDEIDNNFVINISEDTENNKVQVSFSVSGNVKFWTILGNIDVTAIGLGEPELISCMPDAMTSYTDNSFYFTVVSNSGEDITEEQTIFVYDFPILESDYTISCMGKIKDICDVDYNDVNYTLTENNIIGDLPSVTTTVTPLTTTTTKSSVTTTSYKTTSVSGTTNTYISTPITTTKSNTTTATTKSSVTTTSFKTTSISSTTNTYISTPITTTKSNTTTATTKSSVTTTSFKTTSISSTTNTYISTPITTTKSNTTTATTKSSVTTTSYKTTSVSGTTNTYISTPITTTKSNTTTATTKSSVTTTLSKTTSVSSTTNTSISTPITTTKSNTTTVTTANITETNVSNTSITTSEITNTTTSLGIVVLETSVTNLDYNDVIYAKCDSDNDGKADMISIVKFSKDTSYAVIPEEIDGLPVLKIEPDAFDNCEDLWNIEIHNAECEISNIPENVSEYFYLSVKENSKALIFAIENGVDYDIIPDPILGDANKDGTLNVRDAATIASSLAKNIANTLPEIADFNEDGKINVRDAAGIAQYLAKGYVK